MTDLLTAVPADTVALVLIFREDDGTLTASWGDVTDTAPVERGQAARLLHAIADELDTEVKGLGDG